MMPAEAGCAGVDEAGRGPVAGPVVAAAVVLPAGFDPRGIDDSKRLTERRREAAFERIVAESYDWSVAIVEAEEIDRINILQATHEAMRRAVAALSPAPFRVRVDGLPVPRLHEHAIAVVGGDAIHIEIAAASIIAKVVRDRLMHEHDRTWPEYGFAVHKGYLTPDHRAAIELHGPCPIHRRSFAPINQFRLEI